jgi:hypothetical protein
MLICEQIKRRPRDFLAAIELTLAEFANLLPPFRTADATRYPTQLTAKVNIAPAVRIEAAGG